MKSLLFLPKGLPTGKPFLVRFNHHFNSYTLPEK